jgi:uncharacterized membrane protein
MSFKEVSYFKSWLIFFLVASVGGGILGMVFGGLLGGVLGAAGVPIKTITVVGGIVGLIISVPISFFTFKWSVRKYIVAAHLNSAD